LETSEKNSRHTQIPLRHVNDVLHTDEKLSLKIREKCSKSKKAVNKLEPPNNRKRMDVGLLHLFIPVLFTEN
jgi:hypothetical protein